MAIFTAWPGVRALNKLSCIYSCSGMTTLNHSWVLMFLNHISTNCLTPSLILQTLLQVSSTSAVKLFGFELSKDFMDDPLAHAVNYIHYVEKPNTLKGNNAFCSFQWEKLFPRGPFKKQNKTKSRNEVTDVSTHPFPFQLTVQAPYQEAGMCPGLTVLCNII